MSKLRHLRGKNNEGFLLAILILAVLIMSVVSPAFFTVGTFFAILRASIVPLLMALAVLMIIISGGIDVSFPVVAIASAYTAVVVSLTTGFDPGIVVIFGLACAVGALLGLVNGFLVSQFRLPTLIVTLGTQGVFFGLLLVYVGTRYYPELPASMAALSGVNLIDIPTPAGRALLHVLVIFSVFMAAIVSLLLRFTMFGRSLYAIGGDTEAARRAGFKVGRTQMLVYVLAGILAAMAGVCHVVMSRSANPHDLVGGEMDIIAAVVLGGASIFGGRGSVFGTVVGVLLIQVINNSLLLAGVPSAWLRAAIGLMLIVGVGVQTIASRRRVQASPEVPGDPTEQETIGEAT